MIETTPDQSKRTRSEAAAWLARLQSGDCSADDKSRFAAWLAESPQHREAYRRAEFLWGNLAGLENVAQPQLRHAQRVYARARSQRRRRSAALAAAIVAGVMALNPALLNWLSADAYETGKGMRRSLQLSDGSSIELNTDTAIRVHYSQQARTVWLARGEAWFNVAHNSERPFEVVAGDGRIRDIGTQFNVRRDQDQVSIAVSDGEVAIQTKTEFAPLHVTAGQQTRYRETGDTEPVQAGDLNAIGAWRNGILIVKGRTLAEVAEELQRYHPLSIEVADAKLRQLTISGRFQVDDLDLTLNTLATALPVHIVRLDQGHIVIRPKR